ncbi:HEAT repeat domain-containing protein [Mycolicibacterium sp. 22603]|uniref:HEAT repeat domain-containing protein n=1 Tax=Mycolicibacterium sp. 22603 TaxID=3453950 RepID=UPI003F86EB2D
MTARTHWTAELRALPRTGWPRYLDEHSGLPGPRANTELALAFGALADRADIDRVVDSPDEYRAMCAAVALGARATDTATVARAHTMATDPRWRVREGVVLGLQLLADSDIDSVQRLVTRWAHDPDPLVVRAAVAAICEPRLLATPAAAACAIDTCTAATAVLTGWPSDARRDPALRTLRQTLGYCWSVVVAAAPQSGLPVFSSLDDTDPDVSWVIEQNMKKKRLTRILADSG